MFKIGDVTQDIVPCEIISELSGGSMAKLFLAKLKNTEHLFVIKAAEKNTVLNWKCLKREADILMQLYHPFVPEILGYYENNHMCYYIMSYHGGRTLEQYSFLESEVKRLAIDICQVLAYLHQKGIVHGDLKPANVLYHENQGITLLDFGTAEYNNLSGWERDQEGSGIYFQGTLGYAAPECWHKRNLEATAATDIFSLGAVLFYLLERKEPKNYYGRFQLTDKQKKNRWQPVLDKCCALDMKNRYQSIAEVFEVIKEIQI